MSRTPIQTGLLLWSVARGLGVGLPAWAWACEALEGEEGKGGCDLIKKQTNANQR